MRRGMTALFAGVTSLTLLVACGGDSSSGPGGGGSTMSAVINGTPWSAMANISNATITADNHLHITGINTGSYGIAITLVELPGTGTVQLHDVFPLRFAVVTTLAGGSWGSTYAGGGGSVTITSISQNRVTGTFTFTAGAAPSSSVPGMLTVTQGQFDLVLIQI